METTPVYYTRNNDDNFFRRRHTTTIAFAIGLLLFLLPFAELRCGNVALMNNSGVGLATGSEWKTVMGGNRMMDKFNSEVKSQDARSALSTGMNVFLLVAMAAGIFGLFVGFAEQKWKDLAIACAGALAVLMLIAVMIQLKMQMNSALAESSEKQMEESVAQLLKMKFTIWFYLSLASFGCASFLGYKRHRIEMEDAIRRFTEFEFQQKEGDQPG